MKKKTSFMAWLFVLFFSLAVTGFAYTEGPIYLEIVHTNDLHARISDFGKLSYLLQEVREESPYFLYLDAGDIFSGNAVVDMQKGIPMIELLNALGLDALAVGNHEFDYGQEAFAERVLESTFPWLCANVEVREENSLMPNLQPYVIFDFDHFTVGILGLLQVPVATAPKNLTGLILNDPIATAKEYAYLRDQVDVFIALTHMGLAKDRELAQQVDVFDLIIGGHSHSVITEPLVVNGTPIVQAGGYGSHVGYVALKLHPITKKVAQVHSMVIPLTELEGVDPIVAAMVASHEAKMDDLLSEEIGWTNTGLTRDDRNQQDVPLGNFWTDALRHATGADFAVTNNGGLRASILPGPITIREIYTVEPFANETLVVELTGHEVYKMMEFSYTRSSRLDLQTSGLHYEVKIDRLGRFQSIEILIGGEPLELERTYTLAISDYLYSGGDGYRIQGTVLHETIGPVTASLIEYARYLMETVGSIDYEVEGRIRLVTKEDEVAGTIIGQALKPLGTAEKEFQDAPLGNLYADAVRFVGNAQIGILNGSSVTGEIPAGTILKEQIEALDRFKNQLVVVKASGARIQEMILGQSNFHRKVDLQVSGLSYTLIRGTSENPFTEVLLFLEDGTPLDLEAEYIVAYNDFMHGRAFYNLGSETLGTHALVWEAIVEFIRQNPQVEYEAGTRIGIED